MRQDIDRHGTARAAARVLLAALVLAGTAHAGGPEALKEAEKALSEQFVGKSIVAKIDLPSVRSLYVFPNGDFDEDRYYERVKKLPPRLVRGDSAVLRKVNVEKDRIALCINRCGLPKFAVGSTTKHVSGGKEVGSRIEIEFGRPVTEADLRPEVILAAVANVITIEGMASASPPASEARAPDGEERSSAAQPSVELLSAEVEPTKVVRGQRVALVAHLEVSGMAGGELPVTLVRQLLLEDTPLLSPPHAETKSWPDGRHSSRMEMEIPSTAAPGIYTLKVTLRGGALEVTKDALFVVKEKE